MNDALVQWTVDLMQVEHVGAMYPDDDDADADD